MLMLLISTAVFAEGDKMEVHDYSSASMFPVGEPNDAFAKYFSGNTWLSLLNKEDAFICNVTFEPGAINNWHIHHGEAQILVGVGGRGWVQFEGQPAQPINEGDVVRIPPEVKHWHGAAKDSWFSHLSISVKSGQGSGTDWLEPVSRSDYDKLPILKTSVSARNASIIKIAAYTAVSNLGGLKEAMNSAMDAGLAVSEIGELCVQSYAYVGFPRSLLAEGVLTGVVKERQEKGLKVEQGKDAAIIPADLDKYKYGREKINQLFGMNAKQAKPDATDYNSATDIFLKEHLFTDIFYRGVISDKERELATATMLAALGNVNPMLQAHTSGAFKTGNTPEDLHSMADIVGALVGKAQGENAHSIVKQVTGK